MSRDSSFSSVEFHLSLRLGVEFSILLFPRQIELSKILGHFLSFPNPSLYYSLFLSFLTSLRTASGCFRSSAELATELSQYRLAIEKWEQVASMSLESNLTKYSVKDYYLNAGLCYLALPVSFRVLFWSFFNFIWRTFISLVRFVFIKFLYSPD